MRPFMLVLILQIFEFVSVLLEVIICSSKY